MSSKGYPYPYYSQPPSLTSNNYPNSDPAWNSWNLRHPPPIPPPPLPPPPPPPSTYVQKYREAPPPYSKYNNQNYNNGITPNNHINANNAGAFRHYDARITRRPRVPYQSRLDVNNWQFTHNNFRRGPAEFLVNGKLHKKRKKSSSLAQSDGLKKYTDLDAELAFSIEKEYNKKIKPSLIIKFPDEDLNKEIVAQFHSAIENVHFQQPCTARFCFVTLQDSADPDQVIKQINEQKFGSGFLSAEYKRDKEEEQNVTAKDIDPLTLYVGNLAQEITKDNIVSLFPRNKRIDIGYAKKMKYTRYAFIGFSRVQDSIEAFKHAFNQQLHNKSLIVRFRRLNGTVGMPGEAKPQHPAKKINDTANGTDENGTDVSSRPSDADNPQLPCKSTISTEETNDSHLDTTETIVMSRIKQELDVPDEKSFNHTSVSNRCLSISADLDEYLHFKHSPIKDNIKQEVVADKVSPITDIKGEVPKIKAEVTQPETNVRIKDEPYDFYGPDDGKYNDTDEYYDDEYFESEDADSGMSEPTDFSEIYATMREHQERIEPLKYT